MHMLEYTQRLWVYIQTSVRPRDEGQTLVEYALIIALVSIGLVTALTVLRSDIEAVFTRIGSVLGSLPGS
jgi:Flp pilus assembly pilin Flp